MEIIFKQHAYGLVFITCPVFDAWNLYGFMGLKFVNITKLFKLSDLNTTNLNSKVMILLE